MDSDSRTADQDRDQEEDHRGILRRIEEKLERLLGSREEERDEPGWAPPDGPLSYYEDGDPSPRVLGGPHADAPGWDPSFAGPRFDRIDVGAVGSHGVHPAASFDGAQGLSAPHSSARDYYLLRQARERSQAGQDPIGYSGYRRRRMTELDREYADYCRHRQERFDRDFEDWRRKRGGPSPSIDEPGPDQTAASATQSGDE